MMSHNMEKEVTPEKLSGLPNITQQDKGNARVRT